MCRRILVLVVLALLALPAASQARSACLDVHGSRYCRAVMHRKAIRIVRKEERREAARAAVTLHISHRPLPWNVAKLWRANRWERGRLRHLRSLPTYQTIPYMDSWACIHSHEGGWTEVDVHRGVTYHGGLQMDQSFMETYGSDMLALHHGQGAETWTPHEQLIVGERGREARGWEPWSTAGACGLG